MYTVTAIAFANSFRCGGSHTQFEIHLCALSDGGHHPMARCPTIQYWRPGPVFYLHSVSITGSRLAMLSGLEYAGALVIWDWKSAQLLLVR